MRGVRANTKLPVPGRQRRSTENRASTGGRGLVNSPHRPGPQAPRDTAAVSMKAPMPPPSRASSQGPGPESNSPESRRLLLSEEVITYKVIAEVPHFFHDALHGLQDRKINADLQNQRHTSGGLKTRAQPSADGLATWARTVCRLNSSESLS